MHHSQSLRTHPGHRLPVHPAVTGTLLRSVPGPLTQQRPQLPHRIPVHPAVTGSRRRTAKPFAKSKASPLLQPHHRTPLPHRIPVHPAVTGSRRRRVSPLPSPKTINLRQRHQQVPSTPLRREGQAPLPQAVSGRRCQSPKTKLETLFGTSCSPAWSPQPDCLQKRPWGG